MRKLSITQILLFTLVVALIQAARANADEGNVRLGVGYVFLDEEGNHSVNQETFNTFKGLNLSIENLAYAMDNGVNLTGSFRNITLDNRNLRFSTFKSRLFSIKFRDSKYRRVYDHDAAQFTSRETIAGSASASPFENVKIFGGFQRIDKQGNDLVEFIEPSDPLLLSTDYDRMSINVGGQGFYRKSSIRVEYVTSDYNDHAHEGTDRKADDFRVNASTAVPRLERVILSGGYNHRVDKLDSEAAELRTNRGWGAIRIYLPRETKLDFRTVFARTKHSANLIETDNAMNTIVLSKIWKRRGGLRLGYENRIADDLIDRSQSHGLLAGAWLNLRNRLFARGMIAIRNKDIVTGSTLLGDEDFTRYRASLRYSDGRWGSISAQYRAQVRENPDIGAKVDYRSVSTELRLVRASCGEADIVYSYYTGEYTNRVEGFVFADHIVTGTLSPARIGRLGVNLGGTYYRSLRDLDTEKFSMFFSASYDLGESFVFEAKYSVFNYDNFLVHDEFYTGNIVEVSLAKNVDF
jgi:hypothetical protein